MEIAVIEAKRTARSIEDVVKVTMTVSELIKELQEFDKDSPVVLLYGPTYGAIRHENIEIEESGK